MQNKDAAGAQRCLRRTWGGEGWEGGRARERVLTTPSRCNRPSSGHCLGQIMDRGVACCKWWMCIMLAGPAHALEGGKVVCMPACLLRAGGLHGHLPCLSQWVLLADDSSHHMHDTQSAQQLLEEQEMPLQQQRQEPWLLAVKVHGSMHSEGTRRQRQQLCVCQTQVTSQLRDCTSL